jgi:hypothetical protein
VEDPGRAPAVPFAAPKYATPFRITGDGSERPVEKRQRTRPVSMSTTLTSPGLIVVVTSRRRPGSRPGEEAMRVPTRVRQSVRPFFMSRAKRTPSMLLT